MRIIGLDPGLNHTGWAVIDVTAQQALHCVAIGRISTKSAHGLPQRLAVLFEELRTIIKHHNPNAAAVEQTFVNSNPQAALTLGQARGVVLMTPASFGIETGEYAANTIKKAVTGKGHAGKDTVEHMVRMLVKGVPTTSSADAYDALAVAVCHAHHMQSYSRMIA